MLSVMMQQGGAKLLPEICRHSKEVIQRRKMRRRSSGIVSGAVIQSALKRPSNRPKLVEWLRLTPMKPQLDSESFGTPRGNFKALWRPLTGFILARLWTRPQGRASKLQQSTRP